MARLKKLTEKQLYREKVIWLNEHFEEVTPKDFYRDIFPAGSFQREKKSNESYDTLERKPNGILVQLDLIHGKHRQRVLTDELNWVDEYVGQENVILSPISYRGRRRKSEYAHFLYAIVFDLDYQNMRELDNTVHQMNKEFLNTGRTLLPKATYIVLSGHGLHLYYVFKKPMPMYPYLIRELNKLKKGLTEQIWNPYTSYDENRQYQPIAQGFRMVGSASKMGKRYPVRAYKVGDKWKAQDLVKWVTTTEYKANFTFEDTIPKDKAQTLFPEWYQERIVEKRDRGKWHIKRALYDWWKRKIFEIKVGHRYFAIMTLVIYAIKCDIPYEELETDAYSFLEFLDGIGKGDKENRFTEEDIKSALKAYHAGSQNYPRDMLSKLTAIPMPENKRNYRTQIEHLGRIRAMQKFDYPNGEWRNKEGRPKGSKNKKNDKAIIVVQWKKNNPAGKKIDCHRATGLSRVTIDKWWDIALQPKPEDKLAEIKKIIKEVDFHV